MRVIGAPKLHKFWKRRRDAKAQLEAWFAEAEYAIWRSPSDIKKRYAKASIIGNNRVVFNICGNKYRLVVHIKYEFQTVLIRFIGTHVDYDRIDAKEIGCARR
jgi:mRNA interferase HigB